MSYRIKTSSQIADNSNRGRGNIFGSVTKLQAHSPKGLSNAHENSVRNLSDLRIVHIPQQRFLGHPERGTFIARESDLALELSPFHTQRFADEFFRYFHTHDSCRRLKALVIGSLNYPGFRDPNSTLQKCLPQYYYVKSIQTDIMGRSIVVAVRVTRAQLRYAESYADILDCDPESEWLGDAAARINGL
jgi:hypothetical protein